LQVRFHIYYTTMKTQLIITLVLFPILLFAQWPTELMTGLPLSNNPETTDIIKAFCADSEGGHYVCIESNGRLYINHIDLYGNIRWPIGDPPEECYADNSYGWPYAGWKRGTMKMACHNNGDVWVVWEDYRDSYRSEDYSPTSSDLYIQKFDQNRIAQWSLPSALLVQENVSTSSETWVRDFRDPQHLEPQDDGSIILMWTDYPQGEVSYRGNHWAQRFDQDGNPLWETPGIGMIPEVEWIYYDASKYYKSDGTGGVLFSFRNKPLRLLPAGEMAWEFGEVEIDCIRGPSDACEGYDNSILIVGRGLIVNDDYDNVYATVVDTSGNFVYGPQIIGNSEHYNPAVNIGQCSEQEYGILCYDEPDYQFYRLSDELEITLEYVLIDTFPRISSLDRRITKQGYRLISRENGSEYQDTNNEIWGWDVNGNYVFHYGLNEESSNVDWKWYTVDQSGNTWVFWTVYGDQVETYANVISSNGDWGLPSNGVESTFSSSTLPSEISLHVYPNPSNGQFNITFDMIDPSPATFILTNILGQRIQAFNIPGSGPGMRSLPGYIKSGNISLDLNDQASGTYFLHVRTESGQVQQRRILLVK